MDILIIGYGSIGSRHARLMKEMGQNVSIVSRHMSGDDTTETFPCFHDLRDALNGHYDYIIVANKTHEHFSTLEELIQAGYAGTILVEKPLFEAMHVLSAPHAARIFVAYNMRFHPVMRRLHSILNGQKLLTAQARVGQYLPDWRPERDYRTHYSAKRAEGGGVLTDLSHELDYMSWLLGEWQNLTALGGKWSRLEIDSDDVFSFLWSSSHCPIVSLEVNYLDRVLRREIIVNTDEFTVKADFAANRLWINNEVEEFSCGRDDTYRAQCEALLSNDVESLCSEEEGLNIVKMMEAAQVAVDENRWVDKDSIQMIGNEL